MPPTDKYIANVGFQSFPLTISINLVLRQSVLATIGGMASRQILTLPFSKPTTVYSHRRSMYVFTPYLKPFRTIRSHNGGHSILAAKWRYMFHYWVLLKVLIYPYHSYVLLV
jgi:hypothetical protein